MPWWQIVLCVLYVLSPLDLIPDVIPVLGWLDDIGVLGYLIHCLCQGTPGGTASQGSGAMPHPELTSAP